MIEVQLEGVLTIKKDGELLCVVHNDGKKRSQVFSACKDMGVEEIKNLLMDINGSQPKVE